MSTLRITLVALAAVVSFAIPSFAKQSLAATTDIMTDVENEGIIFAGSGLCGAGADAKACEACRERGECTLEQILQVFVNLANFTLGISGTVLLFVFVYGGYRWLMSRGDPKWVTSGREAMTGGVVGIVIVFGAYVAINFILAGLKGTDPATKLETTITTQPVGDDPNAGAPTTAPFSTE